jgi:hypothetical protein
MTAILYGLQEDQLAHRWSEGWQPIPQEFLGRLLSSDGGP